MVDELPRSSGGKVAKGDDFQGLANAVAAAAGTDAGKAALLCQSLPSAKEKYAMKILLPALLALMTLSACETMEGLGRDVEQTGETLTQESQDAQAAM